MENEKQKVRIALDNNALCIAIGLNKRAMAQSETSGIPYNKLSASALYPDKNAKFVRGVDVLFSKLKRAQKGELRFVILPTVVGELFDERITFKESSPFHFFYDLCVQHYTFNEREQELIDELTSDLLKPRKVERFHDGHKYTKVDCPIYGNHNKNHDHDARIVAESCFAGTNLLTFDKDLKNTELIYQVIQEFEQKHPNEAKGFSKFKIICPSANQKQKSEPRNQIDTFDF